MDGPGDDDATLMLAYAAGDVDAFRSIYARHRAPLYRFILLRVGQRAVADDLFQETWSRVIAARANYRPTAKFSTWLLALAHNLVVDSFRRAHPAADDDETARVLASETIPEHQQPEPSLSTFEERRRLQRALEQLPDEQRSVFVLRMEHEMGLEEIAAITGVGRETAKSRLRYALKQIRQRLTE
ncbi:MAG: RNA polymerase sigma factor [Rhodanobacteraceae bacterium]